MELGIFAPLKRKVLKIKLNISRKLVIRLAFFAAMIAAAFWMDAYLEKNPAELKNIEADAGAHNADQGEFYVLAQTGTVNVKTSVQKVQTRNHQIQQHDKFLRKYHSVRNYQVLKAEVIQQTTPLITSYHYLVYQNHSLTSPDEDPLA